MDNLKAKLAALPPGKREYVLQQLSKKREARRNEVQPLPRTGQPFPLSFAQERMWILHELDPDSPLYNVSVTLCLDGRLDIALLEQSLAVLVERHEAFRTTFTMVEGEVRQFIAPTGTLPLVVTDLRQERAAETTFSTSATEELTRPFNLQNGPVARARLFHLTDTASRLMLTMHHAVSDGWSLGVLAEELATVYTALSRGAPVHLPPLPFQCADYAVWQRNWLQGDTSDRLREYWHSQLADAPPSVTLPVTHPQRPQRTGRGDRIPFQLDGQLLPSLKALAQQEDLTLFTLLFAGFAALLSRLSQQEELVLGTPIANRLQDGTAGLVGAFVNTLALRVDLSGNPTCTELCRRVRQVVLDGLEHQAMPFAKLVELLQPERHLHRSPLFQISFGLQENPLGAMEMPGLDVELLEIRCLLEEQRLPPVHTGMSMFDLTFHLSEIAEGVGGWIEYSKDLFDAAAVQRLAEQYEGLLAGFVHDPEQPLSALPLLTPQESRQLAAWNATARPLPAERCLHGLVEEQARSRPEQIAVSETGGRTLSYRELDERANQLARYLHRQGVGPGRRVGLCLTRSVEMVVGLLAILKAGGTYVPLAPDYPAARLAYMMEHASLYLLLTGSSLRATLPDRGIPTLDMDRDRAEIATESTAPMPVAVQPGNIAYIIYTSGSTGQPKGVMVTHGNACNLVRAQIGAFALEPACRVLQFASPGFDAAISETFTTLASGATLVLAPAERLLPGEAFSDLLRDEAIDTITLPPSALSLMDGEQLPGLRTVISAGDACSWEIAEGWAAGRRLLNFYGPTEATVGCCYYPVGEKVAGPATVPIGGPIDNVRLYVVDRHLQPVPFGVAGELLVGGAGVACGYLDAPALTAERFIPDPFGDGPGARLYRTGDLVRYWPDGYLEFLGRIDRQVTLRGFRIELAEIEAALRQHAAVQEALVTLQEASPARKYLVAYVIPQGDDPPTTAHLRDALAARLPAYMVPAHVVSLRAWPLTSNGKIDHHALPAPEDHHLADRRSHVAARSPIEAELVHIWQTLLGVDQVGIDDNFFELGGDSIVGIQMVTRARQAGIHLAPPQLFEYQTIARLAAVAQQADSRVDGEQGALSGDVPLSPIQQWFFEQAFSHPHHWNQSIMVSLPERLDPSLLGEAARALVAHHDALRLRFQEQEGGWRQHYSPGDDRTPVSYVNLVSLDEASRATAIEAHSREAQRSMALQAGPLFRIVYFDAGEDQPARLLMVAHHLVVDAISWRILLEDLRSAYRQCRAGDPISLPPKGTSFRQWVDRLHQYSRSEAVCRELSFWQQEPQSLGPSMPLDFPAGNDANIEQNRSSLMSLLDRETTHTLLQQVPPVYNMRLNEVLLAALALAWREWTGAESLWATVEGHGRGPLFDGVDLTRTVGWFTALFPLRLVVERSAEMGQLLVAIKEQFRAIPHQGLSYGLLRYLSGEPAAARLRDLPRPQISFNYLGQMVPDEDVTLLWQSPASNRAPENLRPHLIDVEARIEHGQLKVEWHYSEAHHRHETIQQVAESYMAWLHRLIDHCLQPGTGTYTPSDFPDAGLDQDALDAVFSELTD